MTSTISHIGLDNYQSLLNLPNAMELYGPLINLWEGANQGEGYLRYTKPIITDIHSVNWHLNAHIYQRTIMLT